MSTKPLSPDDAMRLWMSGQSDGPFIGEIFDRVAEWGRQQCQFVDIPNALICAKDEELRAECERRGLVFFDRKETLFCDVNQPGYRITIELPPGGTVKVG